jgi:hypothetical protein
MLIKRRSTRQKIAKSSRTGLVHDDLSRGHDCLCLGNRQFSCYLQESWQKSKTAEQPTKTAMYAFLLQAVSVHVGVPRGTRSAAHADAGDPGPPPDAAGPHFRLEAAAGGPLGPRCMAASKANDLSSLRKAFPGLPVLIQRPDLRSTQAAPDVRLEQPLAEPLGPVGYSEIV